MKLFSVYLITLAAFILFSGNIYAQQGDKLPDCEWCGTGEAPPGISWQTVIPGKNEPGETLIIKGRVLESDKKTPSAGTIIYAYHTNAKGIYPKRGSETGNGKRHGYLRGWMLTNEKGEFQFTTIKPGSYPSSTEPAHIHITIQPPDSEEYYIPTIIFSDDKFLTSDHYNNNHVLTLRKDKNGNLSGELEIILKE